MSSPRLGFMVAAAIGDATEIIPDFSALKGPAPPCKRPRSKGALSCIFSATQDDRASREVTTWQPQAYA